MAGVAVRLLDSGGTTLDSTTTDAYGRYSFAGLPAGDYIVEVTAPNGFVFTQPNQGTDDDPTRKFLDVVDAPASSEPEVTADDDWSMTVS